MKETNSKQCSKCKEEKAFTEFSKSNADKSGLQGYCKTCKAEYRQAYGTTFARKTSSATRTARKAAKEYDVESTLTLAEVRAVMSSEQCAYCHAETPENRRTIDHVHAMNEGGANTFENVVMACKTCNSAKNSKPVYDFIMKQRNKDATAALLATLGERMDVDPIEALRVLEAQQTAFCEAQWRAKHYPEVDAQ